jgi:hypothetical protein
MADLIFNVAKGKIAFFASLPAANDAIIVVPIEAAGLESDATLKDYHDLATLLAASNNEQTTMGRKTAAGVSATVDDANDRVDITASDVTWTAATGNAVGALLVCYDPDTTTGSDSDLVLLSKHDFAVTPGGGNVTAQIQSPGFQRAS